jgi:predicted enzyme related to lactoylglutathione lyase
MMVGSMQVAAMADFYQKVFERPADMVEGNWHGWKVGNVFFSIGEHSEMAGMAKDPGRVMFNFETETVKEEFARIVELGGKSVKEPYEMGGMWIATLSDPDGNLFQLMSPWKS